VVAAIERTFNQVSKGELDVKIGACLGSLAGHQLKALQVSDLEELAEKVKVLEARAEANKHADYDNQAGSQDPTPGSDARDSGDEFRLGSAQEGSGTNYANGWHGPGPVAGQSPPQSLF
jgi:hypothetical protein